MMQRLKSKAFWGKTLAVFFIIMAVCTIVSRAADSVIVPRAKLEKPSSGNLNYTIDGRGAIKASEGKIVTLPEGLRVIAATQPGVNVEAGGELAGIDMEELAKVLDQENAKLEQLRLQLQKEKIASRPDAVTPQTLSAGKALELAKKNYNDAAVKYDQAVAAEQTEAAERQNRAEQKKKEVYDTFISQGGDSNPEARAAYDQAVKDIDQASELESAQKQAVIAELKSNRDAMQDALNQAVSAYEVAQTDDSNARANQQKAREGADLTQQGLVIDIEQQQKIVDRLNEIANAQGIITAPEKGTVTENSLTEGMVTTGQEFIRIGTGKFQYQAAVDKEDASLLKTGDTLLVEFPDKTEKQKLKIASIWSEQARENEENPEAQSGNTSNITADLEGDDFTEGTEGSYVIQKESDIRYNWILPIEAIREDQKGVYCLAAKKENTILGEEYVAERINLTKKAKDVNNMAVEGSFTDKSRIIVESNKEINEGDRFRIEDSK